MDCTITDEAAVASPDRIEQVLNLARGIAA
jgi:hypothetical protein